MTDELSTEQPRLKFADKHVEPILKGQKTATIRVDIDREKFQIGRRVWLCDDDGERFASVHIHDRGWTTVDEAAAMNIDGHRSYRDTDELLDELRGYYPDKDLGPNSPVELIYWQYEELWE